MAECILLKSGGGISSDETTVTKENVLTGNKYLGADTDDDVGIGTLPDKSGWNGSVSMNSDIIVPYGKHDGLQKVKGPVVTQRGAWNGSVGRNSSIVVPDGFHNGSGRVNGPSMTDRGAATITPSRSNQSIGAGQYLTGAQTILGDPNLLSQNIRNGVRIFGTLGNFQGPTASPYTIHSSDDSVNNTGGGTVIALLNQSRSGTFELLSRNWWAIFVQPNYGGWMAGLWCRFNKSFNLSIYKYLKCNVEWMTTRFTSGTYTFTLGVSTNANTTSMVARTSLNGIGTMILDVSNLSGNYFIYLHGQATYPGAGGGVSLLELVNFDNIVLSTE